MKIMLSFVIVFSFFSTSIAQKTNTNTICQRETKEVWRELADSGRYDDAIAVLLDSIQNRKQKENNWNYWHLGQLYACINEYAIAIEYLKKSTSCIDKIVDREWRLYCNGTIAFLKRDKRKLKIYYDKLWNKHSSYYYFNACMVKLLYENFEKPYREVYEMSCQ